MFRFSLITMSCFLLGTTALAQTIGTPFCIGFNNANCPCGMVGLNAGAGCNNESQSGGALLDAILLGGTAPAVADDSDGTPQVQLNMSMAPSNKMSLFLQGDAQISEVVFWDGLRCVGGNLLKLNGASRPMDSTDIGGSVIYPQPVPPHDQSIVTRCSNLGQPISPGDTRYYFVWHRDQIPNNCNVFPPGTGNASNALTLVWGP